MTRALLVAAACTIAMGLGVAAPPAAAAPPEQDQGVPAVDLSADEVEPNELIDVTISGFTSRTVTVTVCGNDALRGSGDCNMAASESTRVNEDGSPRYVKLVVSSPPTPCPCLIRVASPTNDQVAVAPIVLTGHPTATPVSSAAPDLPLVVSIRANRASAGLLQSIRSSLGGPRGYDVTITVRNTATKAVDGVSVVATGGRLEGRSLAVIDVLPPASIGSGATWEHTARVELPARVWGEVRWSVEIGDGATTVAAFDDTSSRPVLLMTAVGVLLFVALVLSFRLVIRIRNRRRNRRADRAGVEGTFVDSASSDAAMDTARELESA